VSDVCGHGKVVSFSNEFLYGLSNLFVCLFVC
jgi:hypothetical protein